jgi:Na+/melibiose symporter-like transporter
MERTTIISLGRVLGTIGAMAASLAIEAIYIPLGWKMLAVGLSLISMMFMLPILIVGKERSHFELEKSPTLKEMLSNFIKNKYLLIFYATYFLFGVTNTMLIVIPIFSQYVLGNTGKGTVLLAIGMIPALLIAVFLPSMVKKIDKFYLYVASLAIFAAASILQYFTGYQNTLVLYITMALRGIGMAGYTVLSYMFTPDCVEYGHYITGARQEGVSFSLQTFITKLTSAIVNSLSLVVLAWFGFTATSADPVTDIVPPAAASGCWQVLTWFSVIGCVIAIPLLMLFYPLRDKDIQLMARYNNGEITREECDARLSRKY